jgi:zinc D-Ala-D-Ala carboxypeptidase
MKVNADPLQSRYFSLAEFTVSETAARRSIPNVPGPADLAAMSALCAHVLDPLRERLGSPVVITSGFRSPHLNRAVGGSPTSQHCRGEAADIICPAYSVDELFAAVRSSGLPFDQVIHEFGRWVHISYSAVRQRGEALRAIKGAQKTVYVAA